MPNLRQASLAIALVIGIAVVAIVSQKGDEAFIQETTPDSVVPEQSFEELPVRQSVWAADESMLFSEDKLMWRVLKDTMHVKHSKPWAKYLRHKGVLTSTSPGSHQSGQLQGSILRASPVKSQLCDHTVTQHHGYLEVTGKKELFYWMFEAKENPSDAPLVLWLTGGPGCSSLVATFTENGPCRVDKSGSRTYASQYSWNNKANMLYLDQPAGTGFSYDKKGPAGWDHDESEVAKDLFRFMQEFYKTYPQYHKNPFFIWGESYAGHYVPATAHHIIQSNPAADSSEYVPLRGMGIGNGLTDPEIQYQYYPKMAYDSGSAPSRVSHSTYEQMVDALKACIPMIKSCQSDHSICSAALNQCNIDLVVPIEEGGWDVYDLRRKCGPHSLCEDINNVKDYLKSSRVTNVLGTERTWHPCNMKLYGRFQTDWMINMAPNVPPLLANGVRVMIYAGDVDFICNWLGNKAWALALDWPGKKEFNAKLDLPWEVGALAGLVPDKGGKGWERTYGNFSFVRVHDAGHMVPQDQPAAAYFLFNTFLAGKSLAKTAPKYGPPVKPVVEE